MEVVFLCAVVTKGAQFNQFDWPRTFCSQVSIYNIDASDSKSVSYVTVSVEEESAESGAFTLDPSNSGRSSISSDNPEDTNSLKRRKAKEKEKKGGLLKGFLR